MLYVSSKLYDDSAFPFKTGDRLGIKIDAKAKRLIIERIE